MSIAITGNWPHPDAFFKVASALYHLKAIQIIHADLKLANIMLVNHEKAPFKVKLIDFGLACERSTAVVGAHVQTRFYRWETQGMPSCCTDNVEQRSFE